MKLTPLKLRLSPRRELRLALLAATETCWVYAFCALISAWLNLQSPSALAIFIAYWIALAVGRIAPILPMTWWRVQALVLISAIFAALGAVWAQIYARYFLLDPNWLFQFARSLVTLANGFRAEHLIVLSVVYVFLRGLEFAQRPLTLWFIGFQFRLGIVVFFLVLAASGLLKPLDLSTWLPVYFFLSLIAIALARIEEMESDLPLGPRWASILLGAVGVVIFLGLAGARVFTLEVVEGSLRLLSPLWTLAQYLLLFLIIPASFLAEFFYNLLSPLFGGFRQILDQMSNLLPPQNRPTETDQPPLLTQTLEAILPLLQTLLVLAILFALGAWIARAVNRRMGQYEEETFVREALAGESEGAREASRRKKQVARRLNVSVENVRRIYAALVARAADAGVLRAVAETPNEFLPRLERAWSAHAAELQTITRAYVAVHYGEENATPEMLARVRAAWQRAEKAIHARQKRQPIADH